MHNTVDFANIAYNSSHILLDTSRPVPAMTRQPPPSSTGIQPPQYTKPSFGINQSLFGANSSNLQDAVYKIEYSIWLIFQLIKQLLQFFLVYWDTYKTIEGPYGLKLQIPKFFQKFRMSWKSIYRLLLTHTIDPVSFSSIGQVVLEQQSFKVLKSTRSIGNLQFSIVILVIVYMQSIDNQKHAIFQDKSTWPT